MRRSTQLVVMVVCTMLFVSAVRAASAGDCRLLLSRTDSRTAILTARMVAATPQLPRHCRVHGQVLPAVNFEVRMPLQWNGKFYMVGNGGYLGAFFDQSYGLSRGYATASTDTGHEGPSPTFALNNRAAEIDFGFRAVHVSVLAAKELIEAFYGSPPSFSYYRGCSTGGRQGLVEAQRFPDDFDGWSIGAPIYDYTLKQTYNAAWVAQALFGNDRRGYVPPSKLKALGNAVYGRCDGIDGLVDGLIDDPRRCDFLARRDLAACDTGADDDDCFTEAQIAAIAAIYEGPGKGRYPGAVVGGEWMPGPAGQFTGGWDVYFTGRMRWGPTARNRVGQMGRDPYGGDDFEPVQLRNAKSFFKYLAFEVDRPDFEVLSDLDFNDVPDTSFMAAIINATDPDLSRLYSSGKKVLLWHGWADVGLNPLRTIRYYEDVRSAMGPEAADELIRLFMVPGMYHCTGGPGPDVFDDLSAIEGWVEQGRPPETLIAYKTRSPNAFAPDRKPGPDAAAEIARSRPLCAYPRVARYKGAGSIDDAASFECVAP